MVTQPYASKEEGKDQMEDYGCTQKLFGLFTGDSEKGETEAGVPLMLWLAVEGHSKQVFQGSSLSCLNSAQNLSEELSGNNQNMSDDLHRSTMMMLDKLKEHFCGELESGKAEHAQCEYCPLGWVLRHGKCYHFSEKKKNWSDSERFCNSQAGSLAVIDNEEEKTFIMNRMKMEKGYYWLGLINQILLFLLVLTICVILYNKVHKVPSTLNNETIDLESPEEMEEEIPVVICAAAGRMGAAVAAISSIYSNTDANVLFYIVGLKNTIPHIRKWIENSKLKEIKYKTVEFNPMILKGKIRPDASRPELLQPLNFVRYYLPLLIHKYEKVIYLDDDVIVQGDIQELYNTKLAPGHAAAFSDDCDLPSTHEMVRSVGMQNTYMGYLDYRKQTIRDLGISPSTCSFNPGVIVANMTEWKHQRITKQLEKWMQRNVEENLYSSTLGGGVATSPMLIVFHGKYSTINPLWHVRHLGWSPDARYSEHFLQEAKLLHWNGRYKPWDYPSVHNDLWENWFIPDPSGKFKMIRPNS
ncbi:hypothetical protein KIL84_020337 [Mauremys mutica]|uniref:Glycosyltransferase 8 domain-containing protein 2 n=1 Tax=Mauremys mutica TaxID=74926 RepID=A0A9D4BAV3_9SAUR|nr:hypothetical protein KIL84_020337 [Mauremys mutica]